MVCSYFEKKEKRNDELFPLQIHSHRNFFRNDRFDIRLESSLTSNHCPDHVRLSR